MAHKRGHIDATIEYGRMLLSGVGGKKDPEQAKKLLEPFVNTDPYAAMYVGSIYFDGIGVEQDYNRAFELYTKANIANSELKTPPYQLGTIYDKGLGRAADPKKALRWFEVAANNEHTYSQRRTGLYYYKGNIVPKDRATAAKWFEKSAKGGDSIAAYYIGLGYLNGDGVKANYRKAEKYLLQSAKAGDIDAQFQLGYEYHKGNKFKKDEDKFFHWTQKSANQNYKVAQYNLSIAYENGWGVNRNYAWAAYWRAKSAAQNYSSAVKGMKALLPKLNKYTLRTNAKIYSQHNSDSNVVIKLDKGDTLYRVDDLDDWLEVISSKGYHLGYVEKNKLNNKKAKPKPKTAAITNSPFPARPVKVSGRVSCNTRCVNGICWRTYDDGKQVKFQAQQKFNAFTGQFEWDSGSCVN
jgi:TPR repeat protein